jgi:formylglycine-generating enzyme required for sulfatase activity
MITDSSSSLFRPKRPEGMPEPFDWIEIPGGEVHLHYPMYNIKPVVITQIKSFYISKYPITNSQFTVYVNETGNKPKNSEYWVNANFNQPLQPVINLLWQEAMGFCQWLSSKCDYQITLPTDVQWQRAAQGNDGRRFPWGNDFDISRANVSGNDIDYTTPVTQYEQGASVYGVMDMAGNVCEWLLTDPATGINSLNFDIPEVELKNHHRMLSSSHFGSSPGSAIITRFGATSIEYPYRTGIRLVVN